MKYNYKEVVDIIQNTRRFGKWTGYEVSKHMFERLGNPQKGISFVHVAGTNGKGSTTAFLCSILQQSGKKVGMFTSPHLITFRERIRINGEYIAEEDVTRLGNLLLETAFDLPPTMFDYCLAMAVLYFKEQQCDIMVMETGIGGRYDSTNALGTPEVAVITKIGFDHTAILGDTLEAIAGEKAGTIKKGCPVVTTFQQEEVRDVLLENFKKVNEETGQEAQSTIIFDKDNLNISIDGYFSLEKEKCNENFLKKDIVYTQQQWEEHPSYLELLNGVAFYEVSREELRMVSNIPMKMQGSYQLENAATAMLAAKIIFDKWLRMGELLIEEQGTVKKLSQTAETNECIPKISQVAEINESTQETTSKFLIENYIHRGIASATWKGRMELVNENPFFMIDGAHNAHGVHALAESLKALYPNEKFHFIMAVMADKDYEEMIEELLPLAIDFITVTPESNRALQSKDLAECIRKKGIKANYAEDMEKVIRPLLPQSMQKVEDINNVKCDNSGIKNTDSETYMHPIASEYKTIAFGSLYFIGEIEAMLEASV